MSTEQNQEELNWYVLDSGCRQMHSSATMENMVILCSKGHSLSGANDYDQEGRKE